MAGVVVADEERGAIVDAGAIGVVVSRRGKVRVAVSEAASAAGIDA